MKNKVFYLEYLKNQYKVNLTYKSGSQKNIYYRFKDNEFYVSAPRFTSIDVIKNGLKKFVPTLISRSKEINNSPFKEDGIYLFGNFYTFNEDKCINFMGQKIKYLDKTSFYKSIKKLVYPVLESRLRYYEKKMGINEPYKLSLKEMSTRYGSNSSATHRISLNYCLIHYSISIIDSTVVHELTHHYHHDHSVNFYNTLLKYYPSYHYYHDLLKKGVYHDPNSN